MLKRAAGGLRLSEALQLKPRQGERRVVGQTVAGVTFEHLLVVLGGAIQVLGHLADAAQLGQEAGRREERVGRTGARWVALRDGLESMRHPEPAVPVPAPSSVAFEDVVGVPGLLVGLLGHIQRRGFRRRSEQDDEGEGEQSRHGGVRSHRHVTTRTRTRQFFSC